MEGETATLVTTGTITDPGSTSNGYEIRWDGTARESDYAVSRENLGTLTVTAGPADILYVCTEGGGSTWTRGSTDTITFVYKRSEEDEETFLHYSGIEVDGEALPSSEYDATSGSLVVTLKTSYLQGLSTGGHTLQPVFDDGVAQKASFSVADTGGTTTEGTTRTGVTTVVTTGGTTTGGTTTSATPRTGDVSSAWLGLWCAFGLATAVFGIARKR